LSADSSHPVWRTQPVMRSLLRILLVAGGLLPGLAAAAGITVCLADKDYPPLFFTDHEGQVQWLVRKAMEQRGEVAKFVFLPWRRCVIGVEMGLYSAALPMAANKKFSELYAFPLQGDQLDPTRSVGRISYVAVRRRGSAASWDGKRLTGLNLAVAYPSGFISIEERLTALGARGDDGTSTEERVLLKLLAGRVDLGVVSASGATLLLAQNSLREQLEVLPVEFFANEVYLAFNRAFYRARRDDVEAVWSNIGRLRAAPEWKALAPTFLP
jgi:polar amino acid transport system substrate-binding protein